MTLAEAVPFVASQLEAGAPSAHAPAWLGDLRARQRDALLADGLPGSRDEAWKYTSLRALAQRRYALAGDADAQQPIDASAFALPQVDGPVLAFVNGVFRADLSALDAVPDGITFGRLRDALADGDGDARASLARTGEDAFDRLNLSLAGDGLLLRVASGARVREPLRLLMIGAPAGAALAWHLRHRVQLGEGAELTLVEQHVATDAHTHFASSVAEFALAPEARLAHVVLQQSPVAATLVRRSHWRLDARAQARLHALEAGGALARHDASIALVGEDAEVLTAGTFMPRGRQHIDTQLAIRHQAPRTRSEALWRGMAEGRGRGVFRGAIEVDAGADGSDASLSNKNLLLSDGAEIDTKPELVIHADEVQAAHGATVGQLDERALFYLRSRGVPLRQARTLLTTAFGRAPFDSLAHEALRGHIGALLAAQWPGVEH